MLWYLELFRIFPLTVSSSWSMRRGFCFGSRNDLLPLIRWLCLVLRFDPLLLAGKAGKVIELEVLIISLPPLARLSAGPVGFFVVLLFWSFVVRRGYVVVPGSVILAGRRCSRRNSRFR